MYIHKRSRFVREFVLLSRIFEVSFLGFFIITAFGIFDFVLPFFIGEFTSSFTLLGLTVSLVYGASLFAEVPIGIMVDRVGRKLVLLLALLFLASLGVVYYFTQSLLQLMILEIIFGIIAVAFWIPSAVLVRDYSPKEMLGEAQGIYLSIANIGWIIGPILGGLVATYFDIRVNFLVFAALILISFIYAFIVLKRRPHIPRSPIPRFKTISLFREFRDAHPHTVPLFLLSLFLSIWVGVEWVFVQLVSQNTFLLSESFIGFLLGGMMAIEIMLYFPAGYLMDKIGPRYIIMTGFALLAVNLFLAFTTTSPSLFILHLLLAGGSNGWILPGVEAHLTQIISADKRGEMTGVFDSSKDLGLVIGPLIGGILIDLTLNIRVPFLLAGVAALFGIVVGFKLFKEL